MNALPVNSPEFLAAYAYDKKFDAWRLRRTGHRAVNADGTQVRSTRSIAWWRPWWGVYELRGRAAARS